MSVQFAASPDDRALEAYNKIQQLLTPIKSATSFNVSISVFVM
jgi:hypothetical protein